MRKFLVASAFMVGCSITPAQAMTLTAQQVADELIGKVICVQAQSGQVCIRHRADNVTESVSGMPAQQGTWRFNGNEHCVTWTGAQERCSIFSKTGDGYTNSAAGPLTLR